MLFAIFTPLILLLLFLALNRLLRFKYKKIVMILFYFPALSSLYPLITPYYPLDNAIEAFLWLVFGFLSGLICFIILSALVLLQKQ